METYSFYLRSPFTMIINGPTGSGKSTFIKRLLDNPSRFIQPPPERILYYYGAWQPLFNEMKGVTFERQLPSSFEEVLDGRPTLIILDDLMDDVSKSDEVARLFTKGSHHLNASIILLTQNYFVKGPQSRTLSINSHYNLFFKSPRDSLSISTLARQMMGSNAKTLQKIFQDATKDPYSYLFLDFRQETPDKFRILSNILREKGDFITVYSLTQD